MNASDFENRFMQFVSGQMSLPQNVFRQFLGWLQGEVSSDISTSAGAKADKVSSATDNNFAALDSNGNLKDSGKKAADFVAASAISYDETSQKLLIVVGNKTYSVDATEVTE